jgi:hypothetical protein
MRMLGYCRHGREGGPHAAYASSLGLPRGQLPVGVRETHNGWQLILGRRLTDLPALSDLTNLIPLGRCLWFWIASCLFGRPERGPPDGAPCLVWGRLRRAVRLVHHPGVPLAGQPVDPGFIAAWLEQVATATSAGRQMQRVHVVTEPLSDYLRYEMDGYRHSLAAGEDVRILPRPMARALAIPEQDFWLFDDGPVARMHYDEQGRFFCAELIEEPDVVARYCRWRNLAWEAATPYARYVVQRQARRPPDD